MPQTNTAETLVGAAVVAVALLLLALGYAHSGSGGASGYEVNAKMSKVDGLGIGTDVRLAGVKVGSISGMDLNPSNYLVMVHMRIRDDIKIPTDSSLIINSVGVLGASYLSITPGGDDKMIVAGGEIENTQSINANDIMNTVGRFMNGEGQQK